MAGADSVQIALDKLKEACQKRGACGIKTLGRTFRIYDDDRSNTLSLEEFSEGLQDYGVRGLAKADIANLFAYFDRDGSGTINFNEFMIAIRPPLNQNRLRLIKMAFEKLDKDGSGEVTASDLERCYDVTHNKDYQSGKKTKKQILQEFLNSYQVGPDKDEKVTPEEFIDYYTGVSSSIDQDPYFDLMMRQAWKL